MNIESSNINRLHENRQTKLNISNSGNSTFSSFADELKHGAGPNAIENTETEQTVDNNEIQDAKSSEEPVSDEDNLDKALDDLNNVVDEFNQSDEKLSGEVKKEEISDDNKNVINKDYNINDNKDLLPQMNPNMNFMGNGQAFSSFMNNENKSPNKHENGYLGSSKQDLLEEKAILSTMAENIAIANKNNALNNTQTVSNKNSTTVENMIKFDYIIMNQADVEVFVKLVENGGLDMNSISSKNINGNIQISKTLADMLLKAKENNQPLRIDFDNNISIIIRISRDGKISADFLPSTQIAEAYLKENLPLLKQRFDENNIEYESLNQKERRNSEKEDKKKGRNNE
jgi:hypothetical protein